MTIFTLPLQTLHGEPTTLGDHLDKAILLVNVASKCGLTPQYTALEALQKKYADQGFTVIGVPCNQFMGQEPGTAEEIEAFCSTTYGVTFPLLSKVDVNGEHQSPLYAELNQVVGADGYVGDIRWNFEKFLLLADGTVQRFDPRTEPDDEAIVSAIEAALA
jgi:glutathione peroxidase